MKRLLPNHIDIWYLPINNIPSENIKYYYGFLTRNEKAQYDNFYFSKEKNRYLLTRYLIGQLLFEYTGDSNMSLKLNHNTWGRPFIPPAYNTYQINFNISHNEEYIICALVSNGKIGVDIESYAHHRPRLIVEDFLADEEIINLKYISGPGWNKRFIEFWTLKESFIKGVGKGMAIPLNSFYFTINKSNIQFFDQDSQGDWHFMLFEGQSGNSLAIAFSFNTNPDYMPIYNLHRLVSISENPGQNDVPFSLSATSIHSQSAFYDHYEI